MVVVHVLLRADRFWGPIDSNCAPRSNLLRQLLVWPGFMRMRTRPDFRCDLFDISPQLIIIARRENRGFGILLF